MLADLRNVRIPSLDPDAGGRGIDLHFVTRTVTLLPVEDSEQSTAFMKLLRTAKIPANVGEHLDTSAEGGAKLLLLKCELLALEWPLGRDREFCGFLTFQSYTILLKTASLLTLLSSLLSRFFCDLMLKRQRFTLRRIFLAATLH